MGSLLHVDYGTWRRLLKELAAIKTTKVPRHAFRRFVIFRAFGFRIGSSTRRRLACFSLSVGIYSNS